MYIVENKSKHKNKIYNSILLRESYREDGKVKKRTIANLSNCSAEEIAAIKFALKNKTSIDQLVNVTKDIQLVEGPSIGAVWTIFEIAKRLGIATALGNDFNGQLALWQVIARVIRQGSRLAAVRLAETHAACEVINFDRGFNEDDLYDNLAWMSDNQIRIEDELFQIRHGDSKPQIFLYDVTSSYLEGDKNYFGRYGYNRDGKKGKKQIVIGLLCDEYGEPVSTEVFSGNTQDPKTFASQVQKVAKRFGCSKVTFVGDRGMIKSAQIENLPDDFFYITAITKPQIEALGRKGVLQLDLLDNELCEVVDQNIRYILRRNPERANQMLATRIAKQDVIIQKINEKNKYLQEHRKAKIEIALKDINKKVESLKVGNWLSVETQGRNLSLVINDEKLKEESVLDGCYVIKSNLLSEGVNKNTIHERYKDLALVEMAFRNCKTTFLEVRPVHVRKEKSTRGHVLTVMLAYKIIRHIAKAWRRFDVTVQEGVEQLSTLCSTEVKIKGEQSAIKIPKPRQKSKELLDALDIRMPEVLPKRRIKVDTKKKLMSNR